MSKKQFKPVYNTFQQYHDIKTIYENMVKKGINF